MKIETPINIETGKHVPPGITPLGTTELLTQASHRYPRGYGAIENLVFLETGKVLSRSFQNGPLKRVWQELRHRDQLSYIFLGVDRPTNDPIDPQDAVRILEIERAIDEKGIVQVSSIRSAAARKDIDGSSRILVAQINPRSGLVFSAGVSVADSELFGSIDSYETYVRFQRLVRKIPVLKPSYPLGLVTEAMVDRTRDQDNNPHHFMITVFDPTRTGEKLQWADGNEYAERTGFLLESGAGHHNISYFALSDEGEERLWTEYMRPMISD